ncbi:MAG TPA: hypothetical protein VIY30_09500, partial [Burkholderiaceae bacterium]
MLDLDALPAGLDDESADLLGLGVARHDHQQLRDGAVGAPQFEAVEDVGVALGGLLGGGHQAGRVGAHLRL